MTTLDRARHIASSALADVAAGVMPAWHREFVPRRWLGNGHLQTLAGNYLKRDWTLPTAEELIVQVEEAGPHHGPSSVLCHCHWQPEAVRRTRLTVVILHGLEGSSNSKYVLGNAHRAWAAGWNVVRMNMRSCGGADALSPTIYHSGRSGDVGAVVKRLTHGLGLEQVALIGYSMGGNLILKYAGETGAREPALRAVVGVSPLMDLAASSAALHEPQNRVYEWKFLRSMKRRLRAKAALFPGIYDALEPEGVYQRIRTMRDFDGEIVARYGGFRDADDYYTTVASSQFARSFAVPTLILHSLDDPFIRMLDSTRQALLENPHVTYIETRHGGHCAFLTEERGADGYWAERTLLGFLQSTIVQDAEQPASRTAATR